MSKDCFLDSNLKDDLLQDIEKRTKLDLQIAEHIDRFMNCVSPATIYSIMDLILNDGHPQQKRHMKEVKERYENAELLLDDTVYLLDMYEKKHDDLFEDDEE